MNKDCRLCKFFDKGGITDNSAGICVEDKNMLLVVHEVDYNESCFQYEYDSSKLPKTNCMNCSHFFLDPHNNTGKERGICTYDNYDLCIIDEGVFDEYCETHYLRHEED